MNGTLLQEPPDQGVATCPREADPAGAEPEDRTLAEDAWPRGRESSFGARPFIPAPDTCERHELLVHAPAGVVYEVAEGFDMMSLATVRAIFRMRERLMGGTPADLPRRQAFFANAAAMGWGLLSHRPGREHVMGAVTRPWLANVEFEPVAADRFESYSVSDRVKIVWTLETEPLAPALTRLATETRVAATDEAARRKFMRYWKRARLGILTIRWLLLPAVGREAERRWRASLAFEGEEWFVRTPAPRNAPEPRVPLPPP